MQYQVVLSHDYSDTAAIHDALYEYNLLKTGQERQSVQARQYDDAINFILRDEEGNNHGGIAGHWHTEEPGTLYVDYFFVDEALRGQGCGKMLFAALEEHVRNNGKSIELSTNTFQAPGFYRQMGYTVIGEHDSPVPLCPDNRHYRFRKSFSN